MIPENFHLMHSCMCMVCVCVCYVRVIKKKTRPKFMIIIVDVIGYLAKDKQKKT